MGRYGALWLQIPYIKRIKAADKFIKVRPVIKRSVRTISPEENTQGGGPSKLTIDSLRIVKLLVYYHTPRPPVSSGDPALKNNK